jgi:hypothetical protein
LLPILLFFILWLKGLQQQQRISAGHPPIVSTILLSDRWFSMFSRRAETKEHGGARNTFSRTPRVRGRIFVSVRRTVAFLLQICGSQG